MLKVTIPLRLQSLANVRMHWRAMDRLKKSQKTIVGIYMLGKSLPPLPVVVTMTRVGVRPLDSDNLTSACKYVRDSIAKLYGVDDGSDLYEWRCEQRIGKDYAVEIAIEALPAEQVRTIAE